MARICVTDRIMPTQRCPNLLPTTCEYVMWRRGIKAANGIKMANQLILKSGEYPGLSLWAQCDLQICKSGRRQKMESNRAGSIKRTPLEVIAFEDGEITP